jgi:hypothetical protein
MRRSLLFVVAWLVAFAIACDGNGRGDPDPGGRILTALKSIETAIPGEAIDVTRQYAEPHWDSCGGREETAGWSSVTVVITFRTDMSHDSLLQYASERLNAAGWSDSGPSSNRLGPTGGWIQSLTDGTSARAQLSPSTTDGATIVWQLTATAPPHGQQVSRC